VGCPSSEGHPPPCCLYGQQWQGDRHCARRRGRGFGPWGTHAALQWFSFTRLETRTKESNVCASVVVMRNHTVTTRIEREYLPTFTQQWRRRRGRPGSIGKGYELKHMRWDPKDGDLFLNRAKTEETSLEARSGTDRTPLEGGLTLQRVLHRRVAILDYTCCVVWLQDLG